MIWFEKSDGSKVNLWKWRLLRAIFYNILQHNRFAFLFQLIMDIVGTIVFGIIFFKRVKYKKIYIVGIVLSALIFYFIFPW